MIIWVYLTNDERGSVKMLYLNILVVDDVSIAHFRIFRLFTNEHPPNTRLFFHFKYSLF